jgi:hypothetical protein
MYNNQSKNVLNYILHGVVYGAVREMHVVVHNVWAGLCAKEDHRTLPLEVCVQKR